MMPEQGKVGVTKQNPYLTLDAPKAEPNDRTAGKQAQSRLRAFEPDKMPAR